MEWEKQSEWVGRKKSRGVGNRRLCKGKLGSRAQELEFDLKVERMTAFLLCVRSALGISSFVFPLECSVPLQWGWASQVLVTVSFHPWAAAPVMPCSKGYWWNEQCLFGRQHWYHSHVFPRQAQGLCAELCLMAPGAAEEHTGYSATCMSAGESGGVLVPYW